MRIDVVVARALRRGRGSAPRHEKGRRIIVPTVPQRPRPRIRRVFAGTIAGRKRAAGLIRIVPVVVIAVFRDARDDALRVGSDLNQASSLTSGFPVPLKPSDQLPNDQLGSGTAVTMTWVPKVYDG